MSITLSTQNTGIICSAVVAILLGPWTATAEEQTEDPLITVKLRDLLPDESRWFRGLSFKSIYLDQPDFMIDPDTGIGEPNSDDHLWKFELSLDLGKLFWSTDELAEVYALAAEEKAGKYIDAKDFPDAHIFGGTPLEFFARARPNDRVRRFVSAFTFSTGQSERADAESDPDDEFEDTYSATFDPKKYHLTSDRVLTAYKGLQSYVKVHKVESGLPADCKKFPAGQGPVEKLRKLSCLKIVKQSRIAMVPSIKYHTADQFDLASVGGQFVPNDFVEGTIETITFTWDLGDALSTSKRRRQALSAIAIHQQLLDGDDELRKLKESLKIGLEIGPDTLKQICLGRFYHVPLSAKHASGDVKWSYQHLPDGMALENGILHGEAEEAGSDLVVKATDDREVPATKTLPVKDCSGSASSQEEA